MDVFEELIQRGHLHHLLRVTRVRLLRQDTLNIVDFALLWVEVTKCWLPIRETMGVREDLLMKQGRAGPGANVMGLWFLGIVAVLVLFPLVLEGFHALNGQFWG